MEGLLSSDQEANERHGTIHSSNLLAQGERLENLRVTCSVSKPVNICEQPKEIHSCAMDSGEYTQIKTECNELSQTPCRKLFTVSLDGDGAVMYDGCHQSASFTNASHSKKIQNFPLVVRTPVSTKRVTKDVQISQQERNQHSSKATPNNLQNVGAKKNQNIFLKVPPNKKSCEATLSSCHEGSVGSELKRPNMKILTATEPHCKRDTKRRYHIFRLNRKQDSSLYQRYDAVATKQSEKAGSLQRRDPHLDLHHHTRNKEHRILEKSESNSRTSEEKTWPGFIEKIVESQSGKELLPPSEDEDEDLVKEMLMSNSVPEGKSGVDCDVDEDLLLQNAQGSLQFLQDLRSVDTSGSEDSSQLNHINGSCPGLMNNDLCVALSDVSVSKPLNTAKGLRTGDRLCVKNSALSALIATRNNKYICKLCFKHFESISGVRHHLRTIHFSLEAQKCPECGKIFPSNTLFRVHMRTHTGERPYSCQKCGKSFTTMSVMKIHEQRHFIGKTKQNLSCPGWHGGRPSSLDVEVERLDGKSHFIMKNENGNSKDCAVCSNRKVKGGRRETVYFCETCLRKPGLHPGKCFKIYHTKKCYK